MDFKILKERGLTVEEWRVGQLYGYNFQIASWGYLQRSRETSVYGIIVAANHTELAKLYDANTNGLPALDYFPEPVIIETLADEWIPALCYVASKQPSINVQYVESMVELAETYGFPKWYCAHLASFGVSKR
jgi:hypothetical protein